MLKLFFSFYSLAKYSLSNLDAAQGYVAVPLKVQVRLLLNRGKLESPIQVTSDYQPCVYFRSDCLMNTKGSIVLQQ